MKYLLNDYQLENNFSNNLADAVSRVFHPKTIVDVGCATGLYLKPFITRITGDVAGIEVDQNAIDKAVIPHSYFSQLDFSKPFSLKPKRFDICLCLDVMEYVPIDNIGNGINFLVLLSNTIIFSASQLEQREGINGQPKKYWESYFHSRHYNRHLEREKELLNWVKIGKYNPDYFIKNFMIFKKEK